MKLLTKLYLPALLILAISVTSCVDDDDDNGPSTPEPKGSMTGSAVDPNNGQTLEWNSTDVECFHDTSANSLLLKSTNSASGDKLTISMFYQGNTPPSTFGFEGDLTLGVNQAVIERSGSSDLISTKSNDDDISELVVSSGGSVSITTPSYADSSIIEGQMILRFVKVNPGDDDDEDFLVLPGFSFESVPLTSGSLSNIDYEASVSFNVDGSTFEPVLTEAIAQNGTTITTVDLNGNQLILIIPTTATVGTHSLEGTSYFAQYLQSGNAFNVTTGTITISSFNQFEGTVSGTFDFEGTNNDDTETVSITNGNFEVTQ